MAPSRAIFGECVKEVVAGLFLLRSAGISFERRHATMGHRGQQGRETLRRGPYLYPTVSTGENDGFIYARRQRDEKVA